MKIYIIANTIMIAAIMAALNIFNSRNGASIVENGVIILLIVNAIIIISRTKTAKILNKKVKNKLIKIGESNKRNKNLQIEAEKYKMAKNQFKYISDEILQSTYKDFIDNNQENIERLALEEELVDRGLLKSSPMHEKLFFIKQMVDKFGTLSEEEMSNLKP